MLDLSLPGNDNLNPRNQEGEFDENESKRLYEAQRNEANQNKDRKSKLVIAQSGQENSMKKNQEGDLMKNERRKLYQEQRNEANYIKKICVY
jgi:hypothetical protein